MAGVIGALLLVTGCSADKERLYEGGKLVYEAFIPYITHRSSYSLSIGESKQAIYLDYPSEGGGGGSGVGVNYEQYRSNTYFTLDNSQVKKVFNRAIWEYEYEMDTLASSIEEPGEIEDEGLPRITEEEYKIYNDWDGVSPYYTSVKYHIDDNEVSQESYEKKSSLYDDVKWEEIIIGSPFGENTPAVDSKSIVNQVLNQLEEAAKPKSLGEDLKGSLNEELKASLVDGLMYSQWFMDGYKIGAKMNDQELFDYLFMYNGGRQTINMEDGETVDSSTFPQNTYSRMNGQDVDQFLSIYLGQSFTEEDFVLGDITFPYIKKDGYYYFPDFSMGWNSYVVPYIRGAYEIAQDVYYVDFTEYQLIGEDFVNFPDKGADEIPPSQIYDLITDKERNRLYLENRGYAVLKKSVIDGKYQWTLIERNTTGGTFDETTIERYKKQKLAPAQIELKLKNLDNYSTVTDYVEMIRQEISSKELNEQDKSLLTQYISIALQKLNMQSLDATRNTMILTKGQLETSMNEMQSSEQQFIEALELDKLPLPKQIEHINRVNVDLLDVEKPVKIQLNEELVEGIDMESQGDDSLYFSFDGRSMGVAMKYEHLESILQEHGQVTLIFTFANNQIEVAFENSSGIIEKLHSPIQIIIPSETDISMIYLDEELWGGQYIEETNSLVFETKHSGTYTTKKNEVTLTDIDKLTDEQQQAITYLVTRGFFDVENDEFAASKTISRNDFAKTLVRLFFSLDKDEQTTFTDVKEDSPYYQFIASGQQNEIIFGYDDNTFKGDNLISIAHVLSLSGRTLANKKGYAYPTNTEDYLNFLDTDSISENARGEIALAVREGLVDQGGLLEPQRQITRLEAAEILYKLYMLLYEQSPYTIEAEVKSPVPFYKEYKWTLIGGGAGVIALIAGGVIFLRRRK